MKGGPGHSNRRDANEPAIRAVLHKTGVQTWQISGEGIPDLLCLSGHTLFLMEIKAKHGTLTPPQEKFQESMRRANAGYYVVHDVDEALEAVRMELARR